MLHKIEGDRFNSNYWYAKTSGTKFEDFSDVTEELTAILQCLTKLQFCNIITPELISLFFTTCLR